MTRLRALWALLLRRLGIRWDEVACITLEGALLEQVQAGELRLVVLALPGVSGVPARPTYHQPDPGGVH